MPYLILLLSMLLSSGAAFGQEVPDLNEFDPADFLRGDKTFPKVMLVGTFHFDYPNLDAHVTAAADRVDVTSEERRAELKELLDYIAAFKPTKIVVERRDGSIINDRYRAYLKDPSTQKWNGEVYQLAFPIGRQFGVDSLVLGDAMSLVNELNYHEDSLTLRPIMGKIFNSERITNDTLMDARYWELYDLEDKMESQARLLDNFKYSNSPERIKIGHGHYLQFMQEREPDALTLNWYNRNLRIYQRIRLAASQPDDRVLVLFGAGHLGILTQQLESDPSLDLVEFNRPDTW